MLRLSFIVPFYNAESYIEECIRSLYAQDIPQTEYEVICVDDCSLDNSVAVIEDWKLKVENLKLIRHTENKRQGGARNTGLREAKGRYVWFVDADDYIQPNCLKQLLEQAEKENLDVLRFYFSFEGDTSYVTKMINTPVLTGSGAIFDYDTGEPLGIRCCSACGQLIKRSYLEKKQILFEEYVQYEDDDYAYKVFAYAERVQWINIAPYIVRNSRNSTTRRETDVRKILDLYNQTIRIVQLESTLTKIDARWQEFVRARVYWSVTGQIVPMYHQLTFTQKLFFCKSIFRTVWQLKKYVGKKIYLSLLGLKAA